MMQKPNPINRQPVYDFNECVKYVEHKLGYEIRDTLGRFKDGNYKPDREYRDYWHFLIQIMHINNGSEIIINSELLQLGEQWQNEITKCFIDNFGDNAVYEVNW